MQPHIKKFMEELDAEYVRHLKEKGDSWRTMPIDQLEAILCGVWDKLYFDHPNREHQLVDLVGVCIMLNARYKEAEK